MTYEYNIEDINEIKIIDTTSESNYTMIYTRQKEDPNHRFIQSFTEDDILKDYNEETKTGELYFVCPRCGDSNKVTVKAEKGEDGYHIIGDPDLECQYCEDDYAVYVSEETVIESIMDFFDKDEDIQIIIDGNVIER